MGKIDIICKRGEAWGCKYNIRLYFATEVTLALASPRSNPIRESSW